MKKFIFSLAALALVIGGANAGDAGSKGQAPVAAQKAQAPAAKAQSPAKAQAPAAKTQAPAKGQAASKPQAAEAHEGPVGRLRERVGGLRERLRERFGN